MFEDQPILSLYQDILLNLIPLITAVPDKWCAYMLPVAKWYDNHEPTALDLDSNRHYSYEVVCDNPIFVNVLRWTIEAHPVPQLQSHYIITDNKDVFNQNIMRSQLTFLRPFNSVRIYKTSSLAPNNP